MNPQDLDSIYTALSQAIHNVGPEHERLFLATLVLDLIAEQTDLAGVLVKVEKAQSLLEC